MDFDTTIPDVNTQQASQPDQTPPLDMQTVYLVADGTVVSTDTVAKKVRMQIKDLLYHDKTYTISKAVDVTVDASRATVTADTAQVSLSAVKKGMHITAASYADILKDIEATEKDDISSIIKKVPNPVPVDEIKIIETDVAKKNNKKKPAEISEPVDWLRVLWIMLAGVGAFFILLFATPLFVWIYLNSRARRNSTLRSASFDKYNAAMFYLNQLGYNRSGLGPQQYALQTDQQFITNLSLFSNVYQKAKYSKMALTEGEQKIVSDFYPTFIQQVRAKIPFKTRMSRFLNIYNTIQYFTKAK